MPSLIRNQINFTFTAASDMSAASQQYIFVKLDASGNVHPCTAATDKPIGVLQNRPALSELAEVCVFGQTPLRVGGTDVALDALLGVDSTSRAATLTPGTSTTAFVCARALKIDSDNDGALITATVNCLAPGRAA
jgi:hypothetical protein